MSILLLHIGYPKTATTTLQDGLFVKLHQAGKINYIGKAIQNVPYLFANGVKQRSTQFIDSFFLYRNRGD
jgi:hypothetical protein